MAMKIIKYGAVLVGGIVVGSLLAFYLMGVPRSLNTPGKPVTPPGPGGDPPGTAVVSLNEQFFQTVLSTVFKDLGAPSFQLSKLGNYVSSPEARVLPVLFEGGCENRVVLSQTSGEVKTGVRFTGGKILAPIAFTGTYNAPLYGCVDIKGWAQANVELSFDQTKQTVYGNVRVETVNLDGIPPVIDSLVTGFVQGAINQKVNPIEILRASQLDLKVPVKSSNGMLQAQVKDVHSEIKDGVLLIHITYGFSGAKGQGAQG